MAIKEVINISRPGQPVEVDDTIRIVYTNGEWEEKTYYSDADIPEPVDNSKKVTLTNIKINVQLVGKIYWIQKGTAFTAIADCPLPDGELIVMFEQVIDSQVVVDDTRFKAVVVDGVISISGLFDTTGNWMLTAERVNRGLDRIGAQFHLSFDPIEFDVYA